jgi:hypothetical protein
VIDLLVDTATNLFLLIAAIAVTFLGAADWWE